MFIPRAGEAMGFQGMRMSVGWWCGAGAGSSGIR
jgi:hypothetical protein